MASAIGIRVYRIGVYKRGKTDLLSMKSGELNVTAPDFISDFISKHDAIVQNESLERSWYFERRHDDRPGSGRGYVHYGTFGFESNFIDGKTKKRNYQRKITDVEEIPLFYEFWCPDGKSFGLVAFQSFQGRSCIGLVMDKLKEGFENANPGFVLNFKKLMPNDAAGSLYYSAPVKRLHLIKRKAPGDIADQYFENQAPDTVDFELVITARRNSTLGSLLSLHNSVKSTKRSVVTHDGVDFPEAVAEIRVGQRLRKVNVLGFNSDAGVIDLTDAIVRGSDGHPTFESLGREVDDILKDFYQAVASDKR